MRVAAKVLPGQKAPADQPCVPIPKGAAGAQAATTVSPTY